MGEIHHLRARAERCRNSQYAVPVVASVAEARDLARRIAGQLASVSDREALLCLALLQDVETVLARRVAQLQADMAETREALGQARQGADACRGYGRTASLVVHRPREPGA
jgi:hypothetical protein